MAARIQIEVDVNSADFEQFKSSFKQYTDALAKAPGQWSKIKQATKETANENEKAVKAISEYSEHAEKSNKFVGALRQHSEIINRMWLNITHSTRNMASHITDATKSLLQWSGITGLIGGIAGYATVQGVSNLMSQASSGRATAMGMGTSYGKWKAFTTNFARLGDMDSFLNRLNINKSTVEGRSGLYALGFKDKDIAQDTPELGAKLIKRLKHFVDQTPDDILGNRLRQYRLDQYISPEDALLLKRMKAGEVAQLAEGYHKDVKEKTYDVNEQDLKKWQDFKTKMDSAGNQISKVFIEGLAPVAEQLGRFADWSSSKLDNLEKLPERVEAQWKKFGEFVSTTKWEPWVVDFFTGVRDITRALWNYLLKSILSFARWLGIDITPDETPRMAPERGGGEEDAGQGGPGSNNAGASLSSGGSGAARPTEISPSGQGGGGGSPRITPWGAGAGGSTPQSRASVTTPRGAISGQPTYPAPAMESYKGTGSGRGDYTHTYGSNYEKTSNYIMGRLMKDYGLSKEQAAGIAGNLGHESMGFKKYHEQGQAANKGGVGWAQWTNSGGYPRRHIFETYARGHGLDPASDPASMGFLENELNTTYKKSLNAVRKTRTAEASMRAFEHSYEGAGGKGFRSRSTYAQRSLRAYNEGGSTHTKVTVNHSPGNDPNISAAAMAGNGQ